MIKIDFAGVVDISFLKSNIKLTNPQIDYKLENNEIIIAKIDGTSVGFIILDYLWSHIPFIAFIWINEENRNKRIGKSLLDFLENYLVSNGQKFLFSSSMEDALDAQKWHLKMGFIDSGIIHAINENDIGEIFYKKALK